MKFVPRIPVRIILVCVSAAFIAFGASSCAKARKSAHMADATRFFENGDYQKAEIEYKNVLQAEALNPDAICQLGIIFFDEGRLRQSIPYLLKAVELKPGNLEVRRRLAQFYQAFGKTKEASEQARFILEHKPTDDMAPWILIEASLANPDDLSAAKQRLQQLPGGAADGAPAGVPQRWQK